MTTFLIVGTLSWLLMFGFTLAIFSAAARLDELAGCAEAERSDEWTAAVRPAVAQPCPAANPDPFVFVAATRYAIGRTFTSASETIAGQVVACADLIVTDRGAAAAIVQDIDDWVARVQPEPSHGPGEIAALKRRWLDARAALTDIPNPRETA